MIVAERSPTQAEIASPNNKDFQNENLIKESAFDTKSNIENQELIDKLSKELPIEEYENQHSIDLNLTEEETVEEKKPKQNFIQKILNHNMTNIVLGAGDAISALTDHIPVDGLLKKVIDRSSLEATNHYDRRYANSALSAFKKNRAIESFGRVMGIVALPLVKLNDLTLASGLGEFIPQLI